MRLLSPLAVPAALLALAAPAAAAPVDDFTEPGLIPTAGATIDANTTPFTPQGGEPPGTTGCPTADKTGWWSITGNGLPITVRADPSSFDAIVAAYETSGLSIGTRVACAGDAAGNPTEITFPSARGQRYLVRVVGKNNSGGAVRLRFTVQRPPHDDRASALPVGTGVPVTADQRGATHEPGEVLHCGASEYAATVWFRFTATEAADARITAGGVDTVLSVYRGAEAAPLACNDDAAAPAGPSAVDLRVTPGEYFIQVGTHGTDAAALATGDVTVTVADRDRDRDGALAGADCDDGNPAIRPGAPDPPGDGVDQDCAGGDAVDLDRDRDGFATPGDCRDDRADVNPGARDKPGDRLDQDCRGGPAPFPTLASGISGFFALFRDHTEVTALSVRAVPKRARITLTCRGPGCPVRKKVRRVKRAKPRVNLLRPLRGAKLRPGARLRVTVTRKNAIGRVTTWRVRATDLPRRSDRCLPPGKKKPKRCVR